MSFDPVRMKRQMTRMLLSIFALTAVAMAFAVAHFVYGVDWALWAFVGLLLLGFAVQIWFVRGLVRAGKGS